MIKETLTQKANNHAKYHAILNHFGFKVQLQKLQEEFFEMMATYHRYLYQMKAGYDQEVLQETIQDLLKECVDYHIVRSQVAIPALTLQELAKVNAMKDSFNQIMGHHAIDIRNIIDNNIDTYHLQKHIKLDRTLERYEIILTEDDYKHGDQVKLNLTRMGGIENAN